VGAVGEQPIDLMFVGHVESIAELGFQFLKSADLEPSQVCSPGYDRRVLL
jgi:hypothetical protein